ncbi:MAG: hypothetical protein DUW69_000878 [Verrucomicrobia bacterium]|nr:MAG: hypothetical protein DUW69_000878 [Verrucomicrobiota bacterium]
MKSYSACLLLLLLSSLALSLHAAEAPSGEDHPSDPSHNGTPTPASQLADQVKQITADPDIPDKTKAKLIAAAVQQAISNAIAGTTEPAEILQLTVKLTSIATQAAPRFAAAILQAVTTLPAIAAIAGVQAVIEATVHQAVQFSTQADKPDSANTPQPKHSEFGGNKSDVIVSPSF